VLLGLSLMGMSVGEAQRQVLRDLRGSSPPDSPVSSQISSKSISKSSQRGRGRGRGGRGRGKIPLSMEEVIDSDSSDIRPNDGCIRR
jgi:hypothetical protein